MKPTDNTTVYTESTQQRSAAETTNANQDNKPSIWREVLVGGVPGIILGVGGVLGYDAWAKGPERNDGEQDNDGTSAETGNTLSSGEIRVAESVTEDMSFSQAFAAARAEVGTGGAFVWHGNVYSTYRADDPDWQNMSQEQRMEHSDAIMAQVHPTASEHQTTVASTEPVEGGDVPVGPVAEQEQGPDDAGEIDVHIVGVGHVEAEDGSLVTVGYGEVNGMDAMFADSDGDGDVDTVLIDVNGNGQVDDNEWFNAQGSGLTVDGMVAEVQANAAMEDQLFADMPDYTNDADVSILS